MENKNLNTKLSEIISSNSENNQNENIQDAEVVVKVRDGLFEHTEVLNKKYVTSDGRQLLKEVTFEQ
jgi:hypothetical protein